MRNSFSLPVYYLQVLHCDVIIVFKNDHSFKKMKLIPLIIWMINLGVDSEAHESFTFPPQFQAQKPGPFSPDKQFYLPLENHSAMPYFPLKNFNKLPFPYLPPTVTKIPPGPPSPFPVFLSSTLLPIKSDEEDEENDNNVSSPLPQFARNQYNRTQGRDYNPSLNTERKREIRPIGKPFQHPIDRIDTKLPIQFDTNHEVRSQNSMQPRSIVISDIQRDHNLDQMKAASYQGTQYLPQTNVFISTTETAIPILRLSNEMDLDGSFSYEALGADQTHYVQHSRMENTGADKEEQVVEGSYSYVGDNGKTYTVHYIADSNGFRASGDHLPVPPPVPEIIQRAVQYNLAEELKKPPHLKSWKEEEKENEVSESEKLHRFATELPRLSNLFTGRTPESFSHSLSQPTNSQHNLVAAASSQTPIQTVDFTNQMQNKQNSGTISPQITFVASQGAHIPSVSSPQQPQQNIGRIFTTERSSLPQIVNYEADIKDTDKENNRALWRWQYGINANANQNMNKNLISRSSGDDDISINFSDMTVDEYTKAIQQQLEPNPALTSKIPYDFEPSNDDKHHNILQRHSNIENAHQNNINYNTVNPVTIESHSSTEKITPSTLSTNWFKSQSGHKQLNEGNIEGSQNDMGYTSMPKLITQDQFIPSSQTVTQTYNYDNNEFESRRTKILHKNVYDNNYKDLNVLPLNYERSIQDTTPKINLSENEHFINLTEEPAVSSTKQNFKFTDFIVHEDKSDFKPIFIMPELQPKTTTTTTEANMEDMLEDNIFLKNIFRYNKNEQESNNKINDQFKNLQVKPFVDTNRDNHPSPKQMDSKLHNEIITIKKKDLDMADIMNYLSRNQFESNKVRSKPKQITGNSKQKSEVQYFTSNDKPEIADENIKSYRTLQQNEELRGAIKNYKVLQRNNNFAHTEQNNMDGLRRNLSPPPTKAVNLPPLGRAGPSLKSYIPPVYE